MKAKFTLYIFIIMVLAVSLSAQSQYKTLGTWDAEGVPDYLVTPGDEIDDGLMERIGNSLPESKPLPDTHPEYILQSSQGNIVVTEEADVWVTYIKEGASFRNVLGFYTYNENDPPSSIADIEDSLTLVFPNVSNTGSGGGLDPGDKVNIGRFEAGTVIGWFMISNGYRDGKITGGQYRLFSNPNLNPEADEDLQKHNVLLRDEGTGRVVMGFEDIRRDYDNCDQDFNDALFFITANPVTAIDFGDIPDLDDPSLNSVAGRVWNDDEDGIEEKGEKGLKDVMVYLVNENGLKIDSTDTNGNGKYRFFNIGSGKYFVEFVLPANFRFTAKDQGNDDTVDSDVDPVTNRTDTLYLTGNIDLTDVDGGTYVGGNTDISITVQVDNTEPENGDELTYIVTVSNNSTGFASGVKVLDELPVGLKYLSHFTSQGEYDTLDGVWEVGDLDVGESVQLSIDVRVDLFGNTELDLCEAEDFNLFVFEDIVQPSSDTEGKVAVGGNASFDNYSVGAMLPDSLSNADVLVVGGYLYFESGAVYGGNVVYGDSTNLPKNDVSITGGELRQDDPVDFVHARECLTNLSESISLIEATDSISFEFGKLTLMGTNPFVNIFNVDGSDLSAANDFEVNAPNGSVVLINISGTDVSWIGGLNVYGTATSNVLYNFYEAENLLIRNIDVRGSILAPLAVLDFPSGVVNGQVIIKSMISGIGQFNSGVNNSKFFNGNLPSSPHIVNVAAIISIDQHDSDESNNTALVEINVKGKTTASGTASGADEEQWDLVGDFGFQEMIWTMKRDNSGNQLIGTVGGKIYKSSGAGLNWDLLNDEMNVGWIWDLEVDAEGNIYAATEKGLYVSTDGGAAWMEPYATDYDVRAIAIADDGTIYAGTWGNGIFRKLPGYDFEEINEGLTTFAIQSLVVDWQGNIYAGTFGDGVIKSEDHGSTWTKMDIGYNFVWSLAVNTHEEIYAGTYGNGVYKTSDGGVSWQMINDGLNSKYVYNVTVDDSNDVYISTWTNGVYMIEAGQSGKWSHAGMTGVKVSAIMFNENDNNLYIGTSDGVIYKKSNFVTDIEDEDNELEYEFGLAQNYPNPFNPATTIEYRIADAGNVTIKVYDIIGREVMTLVNETKAPGNYQVQLNGKNLASGVYIYRMTSGKFTNAKKFILLK